MRAEPRVRATRARTPLRHTAARPAGHATPRLLALALATGLTLTGGVGTAWASPTDATPSASTTPSASASGDGAASASTSTAPRRAGAEPVGGAALGRTGVVVQTTGDAVDPPETVAGSWLVADLDTGEVLAAQDAHEPLRPASTIKMLTALTLLPQLDPEQVHVGTRADTEVIGTRVGIVPGGRYTADQLFDALLLASGNDAAHALGDLGGGQQATVEAMNETARTLQALDTEVANTSGLDEDGQWSSAYDLALIARAAMAREDFRVYVAKARSTFPGSGRAPRQGQSDPDRETASFEIYNQNDLLADYDGTIGVKTGYTTEARNTVVTAATREGRTLLVTLMGSGDAPADQASALLDWGFAHDGSLRPVGELVAPTSPLPAYNADVEPAVGPVAGPAVSSAPVAADGAGVARTWTISALAAPLLWLLALLATAVVVLRIRAVHLQRRRREAAARRRRARLRTQRERERTERSRQVLRLEPPASQDAERTITLPRDEQRHGRDHLEDDLRSSGTVAG